MTKNDTIDMFTLENLKAIASTISSNSLNTKGTASVSASASASASASTSASSLLSNASRSDLKNLNQVSSSNLDRKATSYTEEQNNPLERKEPIALSKYMDNDYSVNFMEEFEISESFSKSTTDISNISIMEIKQRITSSDINNKLYPADVFGEICKLRTRLEDMKRDKIAFHGKQKKQEKQILKLVSKISTMKETLQIKNFQIQKVCTLDILFLFKI